MENVNKIDPDTLFVDLLISERFRVLRHVGLFLMIMGLGISNIYTGGIEQWTWILNVLVFIPLPILLNVYVLAPKLLLKNRPFTYLGLILLIIIINLSLGTWIMYRSSSIHQVYNEDYGSIVKYIILNSFSTMISFAFIIAGTTSVIVLQLWLRDKKRITELEQASNDVELDMLKNQINPHFLFNMLNNAIVLVKEESPQAKGIILKLREMLNYQFERINKGSISLAEDINFLEDLLHLEKIRRDRFDYSIDVKFIPETVKVPPLLFIPFVENAIKHGNDNTCGSHIKLLFEVNNGRLYFSCSNSVPVYKKDLNGGGLGLNNIRRRLELIYGKDYSMNIDSDEKIYNVNLMIVL